MAFQSFDFRKSLDNWSDPGIPLQKLGGCLNFTKALDTQSPGMTGFHMCGQCVVEATAVVSEGFSK